MIEGLHVDVSAAELKELLLGRLKYHDDKVSHYEKQLGEMEKIDRALAEEAEVFSKTSTASPKKSLEQAVQKHKDQTIYYRFMSTHLVMNETYRLSEADLTRLGIAMPGYY